MKTVARQNICLFPVDIGAASYHSTSLRTSYVFRSEDNRYIHALAECASREASCFIRTASCLCDYSISVKSDVDTRLIAYTRVGNGVEWLADSEDRYVKLRMRKGERCTFTAHLKSLAIVTLEECRLTVKMSSVLNPPSPYDGIKRKTRKGHIKLKGADPSIRERSQLYGLPPKICRLLYQSPPTPPLGADIRGMMYSLNLSSLITLSCSVDVQYMCPPYSVALAKVGGYRAHLSYDIELSPSAGDAAQITLTAIESSSKGSYSIIQDDKGEDITHERQGRRVKGEFLLPALCPDVGIHIHTPYGFSADVGQDPATALAKFHSLSVRYYRA